MKEAILYQCEYCHTQYKEKEKAINCEINHKNPVCFKELKYVSISRDKSGYPNSIDVEFDDGEQVTYVKV